MLSYSDIAALKSVGILLLFLGILCVILYFTVYKQAKEEKSSFGNSFDYISNIFFYYHYSIKFRNSLLFFRKRPVNRNKRNKVQTL